MPNPIILVDSSEVRPGRLDELRSAMHELADFVASSDTRALSYEFFLSPDEADMTVVQVHPDSDSVEEQMRAAGPIFARFSELLTMSAMDVYGEPSAALLDILSRKAERLGLDEGPRVHSRTAGFNRLEG